MLSNYIGLWCEHVCTLADKPTLMWTMLSARTRLYMYCMPISNPKVSIKDRERFFAFFSGGVSFDRKPYEFFLPAILFSHRKLEIFLTFRGFAMARETQSPHDICPAHAHSSRPNWNVKWNAHNDKVSLILFICIELCIQRVECWRSLLVRAKWTTVRWL